MRKIQAKNIWNEQKSHVILDVRTPSEFNQGHIPGAINLPLFTDEERAVVGTLYKQQNPEVAYLKGLDFAGLKMRSYVEAAYKSAPNKKILVHCWRGGKRSASMAWLLESAGFDCALLAGGYKAYRTFCREEIPNLEFKLLMLGGQTGSGKTALLERLKLIGEQIIDLEGLAHHKGSAFGMLGELPQPTCEQFENSLYDQLMRLNQKQRIWVENESQSIGKVFIPDKLFFELRKSPMIMVERSFEYRVNRLVQEYGDFSTEELSNAFEKIQKRLGGQHVKAAIASLEKGDLFEACKIALTYYDKAYDRSTKVNGFSSCEMIKEDGKSDEDLAEMILDIANEKGI